MIKLTLVTLFIASIQCRVVDNNCNGVIIKGINYEKEILKTDVNSPYQLVIDYDTNYLFFSYSANSDETFKSAYINLKTGKFDTIPGIGGGFANTVDNKKHKVYLGGRDGVYEFNFETKRAEHLGAADYSIWQMFYKDVVYFTSYPDEEAYTFQDGVAIRVPELKDTRARIMAVDKNNYIYYSNSTGVYYYKDGQVYNIGEFNVNGMVADIFGTLFFSTPDAIYVIKNENVYEKIATIDNVFGVAIESDGKIIYASENDIIRLKPTNFVCATDEKNTI